MNEKISLPNVNERVAIKEEIISVNKYTHSCFIAQTLLSLLEGGAPSLPPIQGLRVRSESSSSSEGLSLPDVPLCWP